MYRFFISFLTTVFSFWLMTPVFSESTLDIEHPLYQDGKLTIPRVDTSAQAGRYQDIQLQFNAATNAWTLTNFRDTLIVPGQGVYLDQVETIVTTSFPVQVLLKISGNFPNGCGSFRQINQRKQSNKFEITMHLAPIPPEVLCTMALVPFVKIVPLQVYGLPAGTYEYSVNAEHSGTFSLSRDNQL